MNGGEGGRKHDGLDIVINMLEQGFHIFAETHIEHFIGHVKDQHFQVIQFQGASLEVVERAARGVPTRIWAPR